MKNSTFPSKMLTSLKAIASLISLGGSYDCLAKEYQVAFYSDFEPISYSANRDPSSSDFNTPLGYEIDILKAVESIPGSDITFKFHAVKNFQNIWLQPFLDPKIDIAVGGITHEERRTLNNKGVKVVDFTHKTTSFKQSLLMTTENTQKIKSHQDLTCAYMIGAVRGTTGEYRFLAQSYVINSIDEGLIKKGVTVILGDNTFITSDGKLSIYDPKIETRTRLNPPDCTLPLVKYFVAEDSMIPALEEGFIDGIARGYIGNKLVADHSHNKFAVTAVYSLECPRQESIACKRKEESVFFVKVQDVGLLNKLNKYIDFLTDNGKIEYEDWVANPNIFLERARTYQSNFQSKAISTP